MRKQVSDGGAVPTPGNDFAEPAGFSFPPNVAKGQMLPEQLPWEDVQAMAEGYRAVPKVSSGDLGRLRVGSA